MNVKRRDFVKSLGLLAPLVGLGSVLASDSKAEEDERWILTEEGKNEVGVTWDIDKEAPKAAVIEQPSLKVGDQVYSSLHGAMGTVIEVKNESFKDYMGYTNCDNFAELNRFMSDYYGKTAWSNIIATPTIMVELESQVPCMSQENVDWYSKLNGIEKDTQEYKNIQQLSEVYNQYFVYAEASLQKIQEYAA